MIYVTGDTHIPIDISKLNSKCFPDQNVLSKEDFVIICGDFGGVWNNNREEMYWRRWLEQKNFTTLFIDGNHENFHLLNGFETVDFHGGKAHKISNGIYHLMRGQIYKIDGKRFFTFGGASSHDKKFRKKNKNWWEEELPSDQELETAILNLEANGWNVDYVITHCAPSSVQEKLSLQYSRDILTDFLEEIKNKTAFKKWFFGHYHMDIAPYDNFRCVFNTIDKLQ